VEVVTRSGATPTDVQLDLIDPGDSAADATLGTPQVQDTAGAAQVMPDVYSRAQWGADESIRTWKPAYAPTIKAAALHHTADTNQYTIDQVPAMMRSIYHYHAMSLQWGDIGYNVVVDKFGRLFEGRSGGLASTVIGAHAGGFNTSTFGVSMLGNYDTVDTPQVMIDAVSAIIAWKFSLYGVDPLGRTTLTSGGTDRWPAGTAVTLPTVFGHRDTKSTACPGRYGYARLGEIRTAVAARITAGLGAIERRYLTDASLRTSLGAPLGTERYEKGYAWQEYRNGRLYWSPSTGVRLVRGGILTKWLDAGGVEVLGLPITDEGPAGHGGAYNHFANGASIYWTTATGAQVLYGAVRARWLALGAEWGPMGFPVASETSIGNGAVKQVFTDGDVYWSPRTGAHELRGAIARAWEEAGGLTRLGLPTSGEVSAPGGAVRSEFSSGYTLVYSAEGTRVVGGGIREMWQALGGVSGPLGLPASDELDVPRGGGRYSVFTGGSVVWSAQAGAVPLHGALGARWAAAGGLDSDLGLPTGPPKVTGGGRGRMIGFTSGASIHHTTGAARAVLVRGAISERWQAMGGPAGPGLPTTDEEALGRGTGVYQLFSEVKFMWSPATGAHPVYGAIRKTYERIGSEWSDLGLPTSSEYPVSSGTRQDFERGSITFRASTGTTTVASR
jgi:uncharacterized protein with LGFP repeats